MVKSSPVLLFLSFLGLPKKTPYITKDFFYLPNPLKPRENKRGHQIHKGNSLVKINQGNKKTKDKKDREGEQDRSPQKYFLLCGPFPFPDPLSLGVLSYPNSPLQR